MSLRSGPLLLSVGVGLLLGTGSLRAGLLTNAEKNVVAMSQAAFLAAATMKSDVFQLGPLQLTGGTFDDTSWSFQLTGAYTMLGPFSVIFSGNFDPVTNHGTYTTSLPFFGFYSFFTSGSWTFNDIDPITDGFLWDATAVSGVNLMFVGPHFFEAHIPTPEGVTTIDDGTTRHVTFQGQYVLLSGLPFTTRTHAADQAGNLIGTTNRGSAIVTVISEDVSLIAAVDFNEGTFAGIATPVPEAGLGSLTAGLLGLLVCMVVLHQRSSRRLVTPSGALRADRDRA